MTPVRLLLSLALSLVLLVSLLPPATAAPAASPPAAGGPDTPEQVAGRLQEIYDQTTTLAADFLQVTTVHLGRARQRRASGTVLLKKPGKMRWDYNAPEKQVIVCDGTTLSLYSAQNHQLTTGPAARYLEADVTYAFFAGKGRILEDFMVGPGEHGVLVDDAGYHLRLEPRRPHPQVEAILLVLDPASFMVTTMEIRDRFGGVNRFTFTNVRRNLDVDDASFQFQPPPGTEIVEQGTP